VPGSVALVGAGEFLPAMDTVDRGLLDATGVSRPRVAILPTASWPDGDTTFQRWAAMGVEHFTTLGAEVEPVLVRTVEDGADAANLQAVGEADLIYLSGGKPAHLLDVLLGSPLGDALRASHARGAVIAGCSAGAMVLAGRQAGMPRPKVPFPITWRSALGLVQSAAVLPHYDAWPEALVALIALQAPRDAAVLGIDEETAAIGCNGAWQVQGRGRVTLWRGRRRERYRKGEAFRI
jgi:cyanophycinase-like exopeptidase